MTDALGWIARRAGTRGKYATVDAARVAVAGQSCGRLEAYQMRDDPRVQYLGIFNSGFLDLPGFLGGLLGIPAGERPETIEDLDLPVFDFLGGEEDIAYPNEVNYMRRGHEHVGRTDIADGGEINVGLTVKSLLDCLRESEKGRCRFIDAYLKHVFGRSPYVVLGEVDEDPPGSPIDIHKGQPRIRAATSVGGRWLVPEQVYLLLYSLNERIKKSGAGYVATPEDTTLTVAGWFPTAMCASGPFNNGQPVKTGYTSSLPHRRTPRLEQRRMDEILDLVLYQMGRPYCRDEYLQAEMQERAPADAIFVFI